MQRLLITFMAVSLGLLFTACGGSNLTPNTVITASGASSLHRATGSGQAGPAQYLYVTNYARSNDVTVYDLSGKLIRTIVAGMGTPVAVAVGSSGKILVANLSGGSNGAAIVHAYRPNGSLTNPTIDGYDPLLGLAIGANGTIYACNARAADVIAFKPDGTFRGLLAANGLIEPDGVAVDASGKIYVADYIKNAVTTYKANGTPVSPTITAGLSGPSGLAVGSDGKIYVANWTGNSVTTYNADGTQTTPTIKVAHPQGVALDMTGKIYVSNLKVVTVYNPDGTKTGLTITAGVDEPYGLAVH